MATLYSPLQLGDIPVANRIFFAPLTRVRSSADNVPGDLVAQYYAQRATGGLLIAEATMVDPNGLAWPHQPGIHNAAQVEGWKKVTKAVHDAGGRIILQIWHPGRATHQVLNKGLQPVSSSASRITDDVIHTPEGKKDYPVARALAESEIPAYVALFKQATANAKEAGFDGVQIHGAHGYLIDQFLRDSVNDRTDSYGGSIPNRAKFLFEVIDAAIEVFGAGRVSLRISPLVAFNDIKDSNPIELTKYIAEQSEKRKLGFLELRHAQHDLPQELELLAVARKAYTGPIVRNGGFTKESGEAAIKAGLGDAIAYGVPFLANPDLVKRFQTNAPLNAPNPATFYYPESPVGYTDYPFLAQ